MDINKLQTPPKTVVNLLLGDGISLRKVFLGMFLIALTFCLIIKHIFFPTILVSKNHSPTSAHSLIIKRGSPFLFGPTTYYVSYKKWFHLFSHTLFKTDVSDDGGIGQVNLVFHNSTATLTFSGDEQGDEIWEISFGKEVVAKLKDGL